MHAHCDWKGFFGNLYLTNWDFVCMCFKGGYYNMTSCFCCSKAWLHPVLAVVVVGLALNGPKSGQQLNFIMFAILWNMIFAWRANQWPLIGEDIGFLLLSFNFWPYNGFLRWHKALQGPQPCLIYRFCCYREARKLSGVSHSWTLSKTTDANLDCVFVKTHFFYNDPWL